MTAALLERLAVADFTVPFGQVTAIRSDWIDATGPAAGVGTLCTVEQVGPQGVGLLAEVVAVDRQGVRLAPLGAVAGVLPGARVTLRREGPPCPSLDKVAGRAIDALGQPIDGGPPLPSAPSGTIARRLAPLERTTPKRVLETGLRVIDGLLPLGHGQKIGVFAPSGAGKSTLIEDLCSHAACDRLILCLIGERGREVERAWQMLCRRPGQASYTLVAATSDESASLRVRALDLALTLAEQARAAGEHVLLLVDSVTRVAMALRELGMAAGEPPAARGFTANVFSHLPRQVERCGAARSGGAVTAVFSVLSETDEVDDPLVEMMKSILDGHIVLSRSLAERRHFPAVDIARSVSRLAEDLLDKDHARAAAQVHAAHATYEDARAMVESGIYRAGSSPAIDQAIAARPGIDAFLRQPRGDRVTLAQTRAALRSLGAGDGR